MSCSSMSTTREEQMDQRGCTAPDENLKEFLETPGNERRHEAHTCVLCHV